MWPLNIYKKFGVGSGLWRPPPPDRTARTGQVSRSSIGNHLTGLKFVQLNPQWGSCRYPLCSTHNCRKAVHNRPGFCKDCPKLKRSQLNSSVTNLHIKDCRVANGPLAGTGCLLTFQTTYLVGILYRIRTSPFGFLAPSYVFTTLIRLLSAVTIASRPRLPMSQRRNWGIQASFPVVRVLSSALLRTAFPKHAVGKEQGEIGKR